MSASDGQDRGVETESTVALVERARSGDQHALEALLARYRPRLSRWAHRRLPAWARDLADTDDLVQTALVGTVRNLAALQVDGDGFQQYLRAAVRNAIHDEIRRVRRKPLLEGADHRLLDDGPSPLEHAMGRQRLARYEAALQRLAPDEREAIVARMEFGLTHVELAAALGKNTPDAARKLCGRALARLLEHMQNGPAATPR